MMREDPVIRTTHQSYSSRVKDSCQGFLLAPLLILGAICLLVWNEGNAIRSQKSLDEGLKATVSLPEQSVQRIDPAMESKLVHLVGTIEANTAVSDPMFGILPSNAALKLRRKVQMFQWVQHSSSSTRKNTGGSTTTTTEYTYSQSWESSLISSSRFEQPTGHENPTSWPYSTEVFAASSMRIGAYDLSSTLVDKINWFRDYTEGLKQDDIPAESVHGYSVRPISTGYYLEVNDGSGGEPKIGDIKITFQVINSQVTSIVAAQVGNTLTTYPTKAGHPILLMEPGIHTALELFQHAQTRAVAMTWLLRFLGFVLVYVGLQAMSQPLAVLADVIPALGNFVGSVTSCVLCPLAFAIALFFIVVSWIIHRPLVAIPFVIIIGAWLMERGKSMKSRGNGPSRFQPPGCEHEDGQPDLERQVLLNDFRKRIRSAKFVE